MKKKPTRSEKTSFQPICFQERLQVANDRIFSEIDGVIYIGGQQASQEMLKNFKVEAERILATILWETLEATVTAEAADLALRQSTNFEQVQFAKAQYHVIRVIKKVLLTLSNT